MRLGARRAAAIAALLAALAAPAAEGGGPADAPADAGARPTEGLVPSVVGLRPVTSMFEHLERGAFGPVAGVSWDPVARELYVVDGGKAAVAIFDRDGVPRFAFGGKGTFREPAKAVADPHGRIYALDLDRARVLVFNYRGEYQRDLAVPGVEPGAKPSYSALAVDGEGNLYLADAASSKVRVVDPEGRLKLEFGKRGAENGAFLSIAALAVARHEIYVVDHQGVPVQVFDPRGNFVRGWGAHQMGAQNFSLPEGIAVDAKGRIWVVDALRHEIKLFLSDGTFVDRWGGYGTAPGQVMAPCDVAVDGDRLFVAEKGGQRVQVLDVVEGFRDAYGVPVDLRTRAR